MAETLVKGSSLSTTEVAAAIDQLRTFIEPDMVNELQPSGPNAVYTTWVTVFLLVYQRLSGNASLQEAVAELLKIVNVFSSNKRVQNQTLSSNSSAYSRARSRLDGSVTDAVADHVYEKIVGAMKPSLGDRRAFIIDGTTTALQSSDELRKQWPAGTNQHGPGTWPICQLVVAHELASGAALRPEVGAMYGPGAVSELELSRRLLHRIPANSMVMGDKNFGVFYFVYAAAQAGHEVLVRLTERRYLCLKRSAKQVGPGRWTLTWKPSRWECRAHPDLAADAVVEVTLHEFVGFSGKTIWVATTSDASVEELAKLYAQRWGIETDIKNFKTTLECDALRGKSVAMIMKEIAIAIVSYNLVVQVRRLAAERVKVPPRRLSFTGVWSLVKIILLTGNDTWTAEEWEKQFELVLRGAAQRKIPNRPGRSYPRKILARGRKFPERRLPNHDKEVK
jgi:hypothetical protein